MASDSIVMVITQGDIDELNRIHRTATAYLYAAVLERRSQGQGSTDLDWLEWRDLIKGQDSIGAALPIFEDDGKPFTPPPEGTDAGRPAFLLVPPRAKSTVRRRQGRPTKRR